MTYTYILFHNVRIIEEQKGGFSGNIFYDQNKIYKLHRYQNCTFIESYPLIYLKLLYTVSF